MSLILPFPFDFAAEDRRMGCKFVLWMGLNLTNFFFDHLDPTILKMHPTSKNNEKWVHFIIMKSKPGPRVFIVLNKIFSTENIYKNYISYLLFAHFFQVIFCIIKLILKNSLFFVVYLMCMFLQEYKPQRKIYIIFSCMYVCISMWIWIYKHMNAGVLKG